MAPTVGDAHCHLADLDDPERALREAADAGVSPVLAVSMGPDDGAAVLHLRSRHPGQVRAGLGLHPSRVPGLDDSAIAAELALVAERLPGADFIGEIGLDHRDATTAAQQRRQREVLERMLDLAEQARLPVNLHSRRADRELVETVIAFRRRTGLPALMHWFTHSKKLVGRCAWHEILISAGPSTLDDPVQAEVAAAVPEHLLVVETDAPVAYQGRVAAPLWAGQVAAHLARVRGVPESRLRSVVARNLARFLGQETGAG